MTRRILVTGANRGLGLELARHWIDAGYEVWGTARTSDPADFLALHPAGSVELDLTDESSIVAAFEALASKGRDSSYCVSKAALNMWSVKAATALRAEGIAVVMLHPGWVSTDMGGSSAPLTPAESASAIVDTVDRLTLADSGRFVRWDGGEHPW